MKLGYLSNHNPLDRNAFSGTSHYLFHALSSTPSCDVRLLGNPRLPNRLLDRFVKRDADMGSLPAADFAGLDAIISLVSTDLVINYGVPSNPPVVHCTDATPGFLKEFYGFDVPDVAFENERRAYDCAELVLFSSEFMRQRALAEFGGGYASKMVALPWGANLDSIPSAAPEKPPLDPVRLLFIGKDWERKGGPIAVATLTELLKRGRPAELHLVGSSPEGIANEHDKIVDHGYLNKNKRWDRLTLEEVLSHAHFFLLPTQADCTPMVVAEANSHGIPVLISDVGGIASLMNEPLNGALLPAGSGAAAFADRVESLSSDPRQYRTLSETSHEHFVTRLTWAAWSSAFVAMMSERLSVRRASGA